MQDWELVHRGRHTGEMLTDNPYQSAIELDFPVETSKCLIGVRSEIARPRWRMGVWASARLQFPVPELSEFQKVFSVARQSCLLNRLTLFSLPSLNSYNIVLATPWWLRQIELELWRWVGEDFIDPAVEKAIDEIEDKLEGKELILRQVVYSEINEGKEILVVSAFTEATPYERFEVGRFQSVFNAQTLSDPIIRVSPYQLVATFTGKERVLPETVKVRVFL